MRNRKPKGMYILGSGAYDLIYGPAERDEIAALIEMRAEPQTPQSVLAEPSLLSDVEIVISGWGGPRIDSAFLEAAPNLKAFFYGAGATGDIVSPEAYERGIVVTSAATMNGVPVAEFTVAAITLCLKQAFFFQRNVRQHRSFASARAGIPPIASAYGSTVALISMGAIGRAVQERLSSCLRDVRTIVYDPYLSESEADEIGVARVSLDEAFRQADVVSLHTPWLPETERMIRGAHFAAMRPGAAFINTARGAVVAEDEMIPVLEQRLDITAVLDVTHPEPPAEGSPLYTLPNVFLTPHVAGSMEKECLRMGQCMVNELRRYLNGDELLYRIRPEQAVHSSHRPMVK